MKHALAVLLLLGMSVAQSAPKPQNLSLARVSCKTCAVEVKSPRSHKLRNIALVLIPVAAFGLATAFENSAVPVIPKLQFVPIHTNPPFCIIGQTC